MLQLLSCSIWVSLGASHCRRGEQLPTSTAEPREQALCHQHTWPLPSNPPREDQSVPTDLHAGTTHPTSAHHPLQSLSQSLWGQASHPILVTGTAWALSPHLSPFFFLLKTCLLSQHPWAWRDWELLELSLPGGFPLYRDIPCSATPAHVQWEPSSTARGSQQALLALHTMAAALSSPPGTAQLAMAPLVSSDELD